MKAFIAILAALAIAVWAGVAHLDKVLTMAGMPLMPWFDGMMLISTTTFSMLFPWFILLAYPDGPNHKR